MSIKMTVLSNDYDALADRLESLSGQIVRKTTLDIHGLAVETSPYDTGHMQSTHKPEFSDDGQRGEVNVYADYSLYVHEGHRTRNGGYVAGRPWLAEAAEHVRPAFNGAIYVVFRAGVL